MSGPLLILLRSHDEVNPGRFMLWIDVLLLCVLALFSVLALPRTLSYFSEVRWWKRGIIFYTSIRNNLSARRSFSSDTALVQQVPGVCMMGLGRVSRPIRTSYTIHNLRFMIRTPILPRVSLGRAILMALYFGVLLFGALYRNNILLHPVRAGYVAASQLPFVYILATKNNIIGFISGCGYECLNYLHRFIGRLIVLAVNVHAIGFFYEWINQRTFTENIKETSITWALVGLISSDILFFFSPYPVCQTSYNLFYYTHLIAGILVLIAVSLHQSATWPYSFTAASLYIFDRLFRIIKSRLCMAHIECVPELGATVVHITDPKLNAGCYAGQHIRLRVLSPSMGLLGWAEIYPYTISGAPQFNSTIAFHVTRPHSAMERCGTGDVVLLVKKVGRWSRNLYVIAEKAEYDSPPSRGTEVDVVAEGPYGGTRPSLSSFSGALFVVGGSGISFALAATEDLLRNGSSIESRNSNCYTIELIWCVQHARAITPLLPLLSMLLEQSGTSANSESSSTAAARTSVQRPVLKIGIFYTRALNFDDAQALRTQEKANAEGKSPYANQERKFQFPQGLTVHSGRPWLPLSLTDFLERTAASLCDEGSPDPEKPHKRGCGNANGVVISVCGPATLADDAWRAVGNVDEAKRRAVGGISIVEEAFHW